MPTAGHWWTRSTMINYQNKERKEPMRGLARWRTEGPWGSVAFVVVPEHKQSCIAALRGCPTGVWIGPVDRLSARVAFPITMICICIFISLISEYLGLLKSVFIHSTRSHTLES